MGEGVPKLVASYAAAANNALEAVTQKLATRCDTSAAIIMPSVPDVDFRPHSFLFGAGGYHVEEALHSVPCAATQEKWEAMGGSLREFCRFTIDSGMLGDDGADLESASPQSDVIVPWTVARATTWLHCH